jgi:2-methylcitrate dehydratase PrpD
MEKPNVDMTRRLARFVADTTAEDIPPQVFEHAKVAFMDWIGVLMAGKDEPLVKKLINYADFLGGHAQATVLGHGVKKNVCQAALINGAASHALDYDDTLRTFIGHPSVTLFPALLAYSEWRGLGGRDLLTAYLVGLQVGASIGASAGLEHYSAGWHATSTIGRLASAAGCAKLMGLGEEQVVHALGIAATQACGLKRVFGSMCKPFHAGAASQGGLAAVLLASDGFTSTDNILEGPFGFLQVFGGKVNDDFLERLGKKWEVEAIIQKYHASCHFTHSPIEGVLKAVAQKDDMAPEEIREVRVRVSELAARTAGIEDPRTELEGKFSMRYCVANALLGGPTGLRGFTLERVNDPQRKEFIEKVKVIGDPQIPDGSWLANVEIELESGRILAASADVSQEVPELAVKRGKITSKFHDLCDPVLGEARALRLEEMILKLEDLLDMRDFIGVAEDG